MDLAPEICMDLGRGGSRRTLRIPFTLSGRAGPRPWGSGVSGLRHPTAPPHGPTDPGLVMGNQPVTFLFFL